MSTQLPRDLPAHQGVDPAAVLAFVDAVDTDPSIELHSVMVLRHGHVVAEGWWAPHTPERTRLVYSISKSFTSTAVGMALDEGLFSLDDTVISHFPEFEADITDPRSRRTTMRHLAMMGSGHDRDVVAEAAAKDPDNLVRGFLMIPPDAEPGTLFAYNQPCTFTLASVIQGKTGMLLTEYLRPRLFDPLGIGEVGWLAWPPDRQLGFSGLFARTEDLAKLGQLYLQRGRWGDAQLVPESYVAEATRKQIDNSMMENPDWSQGYGFQFWIARHGFRGDGAYGQFCVVLPEQDAVIATTGGTEEMQAVLNHLWEHLLPGLGSTSPDTTQQAALEQRLASLALAPCAARSEPDDWAEWQGRSFPLTHPAASEPMPLESITVDRGVGGLEIRVSEENNALTLPVGASGWRVSEPVDASGQVVPVAASGGWLDDGSLRVEVIYLETPHRLDIVCPPGASTAEVAWRGAPLHGGKLRTMHRPR